jgi:uncharacterized protein
VSRVVHFEFSADDPARAAAFFETVFGWRLEKWQGPFDYWMVSTAGPGEAEAPGIDGGLGPRPQMSRAVVNPISVDDVDAALERVTAAGGVVAMPRTAIPGVGWNAYFTDPEGNLWGVYEDDPAAA